MTKIQGIVQIATAPDGTKIAEAIRERIASETLVPAGICPEELPQPHEIAVLVFVLTEQALADPAVRRFADLAAASRFPCLPVPPSREGFDFRALTGDLDYLGRLNAVAWDDEETPGEAVIGAIRRHLGLEPFKRDCRLFISYRRSDGMEAAHAIYRYFRDIEFDAFLDTEDEAIEPGEEFQPRIQEAIPEKDFLLLIDSPDAAESAWVREEVSIALTNRVAILVVRVGGSEGFPQVRDLPAMQWGPDTERSLFELERAVRSRLATRRSFDRRVLQTIDHLKPLLPLTTSPAGQRRLLITLGKDPELQRCLLEYEDAAYDLTRLHRLAVARQEERLTDPANPAVLVHRGRRLSREEQDALDWARRDEPLHVLALDQVVSFFLPVASRAGQPNTESP